MDNSKLIKILEEAEKELQKFIIDAEKGVVYRQGKIDFLKEMLEKPGKDKTNEVLRKPIEESA